jgi:tetratricopeptide (TPR) repeat protein
VSANLKRILLMSVAASSSLLVDVVSAEPSLSTSVQTCVSSVASAGDNSCDSDQDEKEQFRELQLLTIRELNASISKSPNEDFLYLRRGFIFSELGDAAQALASYDRAISLNPKNPQGYFYRGSLRFKMGYANLALQDYAQALRLNPNFREVYLARAFARAELGDEGGAIADSAQARRLTHEPPPPPPSLIPR